MGGLRITPDITLSRRRSPSSRNADPSRRGLWESGGNAEAIELARVFFIEGVPIAAICAATRALACAGMLDDFHHTSNSREYLAATGYRGGEFYCDVPAITDENVITARVWRRSSLPARSFARSTFTTASPRCMVCPLQVWRCLALPRTGGVRQPLIHQSIRANIQRRSR